MGSTHDIRGNYSQDLVSNAQFRMEAVKKYLTDGVVSQIEGMERGQYLKVVRDKVAEPIPQPPQRGLIARVLG